MLKFQIKLATCEAAVQTKRLYVVEDDYVTRTFLRDVLENAGYTVLTAADGPEALKLLQRQGLPHLILLDLGLPTMHGFAVSEQIKRMGDVPIIILTGDDSKQAVVHGIRQYAEDYITKPFVVEEVLARIERVLSRITDFSYAKTPLMAIDSALSIDFANGQIILDGRTIDLTPIETTLLHNLVRSKGRIVSVEYLLARVWPGEDMQSETLRVHMHRLRRKLHREKGKNQYIYTEREQGYSFRVLEETSTT